MMVSSCSLACVEWEERKLNHPWVAISECKLYLLIVRFLQFTIPLQAVPRRQTAAVLMFLNRTLLGNIKFNINI